MEDAIDLLLSRASTGALREPAPDGAVLDRILAAALRAPDHGKLRPWHLVLVRGPARARLLQVVLAAALARDPQTPEPVLAKFRARFGETPLIIALGAALQPDHKIPEFEQLLSVGAAAMNLLNAIHMAGFGAMWVTGPNAYDPTVAAALGLTPPSRLAGFLLV